ncbi:hypothetical protein QOT17_015114 [Balamuthia mandrillaris]
MKLSRFLALLWTVLVLVTLCAEVMDGHRLTGANGIRDSHTRQKRGFFFESLCTCKCCKKPGEDCYPTENTTFEVTSCSSCVKEACRSRFDVCASSDIDAITPSCLDLKTDWTEAVIIGTLVAIGILLVLSIAQYKVPFIRKIFQATPHQYRVKPKPNQLFIGREDSYFDYTRYNSDGESSYYPTRKYDTIRRPSDGGDSDDTTTASFRQSFSSLSRPSLSSSVESLVGFNEGGVHRDRTEDEYSLSEWEKEGEWQHH